MDTQIKIYYVIQDSGIFHYKQTALFDTDPKLLSEMANYVKYDIANLQSETLLESEIMKFNGTWNYSVGCLLKQRLQAKEILHCDTKPLTDYLENYQDSLRKKKQT